MSQSFVFLRGYREVEVTVDLERSEMSTGSRRNKGPRDCRVCKDFFVKISGSVDTGTKVYG